MSLDLIAHEVRQLASSVNDGGVIANFINKVHNKNYTAGDIEKILMGLKPTDSIPKAIRYPEALRETKLMAEPIGWSPPISTVKRGIDPLAQATNAYLKKHHKKIMKALASD